MGKRPEPPARGVQAAKEAEAEPPPINPDPETWSRFEDAVRRVAKARPMHKEREDKPPKSRRVRGR